MNLIEDYLPNISEIKGRLFLDRVGDIYQINFVKEEKMNYEYILTHDESHYQTEFFEPISEHLKDEEIEKHTIVAMKSILSQQIPFSA